MMPCTFSFFVSAILSSSSIRSVSLRMCHPSQFVRVLRGRRSCVSFQPTLKMSRAPQRHDRTDGQARRLHFAVGRLGRARDSPTPTPENEPTLEQPAERRAVTPAMVKPDRPCWDCHQPFTPNVPRDHVHGWSPHDGPTTEARRVESPELRRGHATDGRDPIR